MNHWAKALEDMLLLVEDWNRTKAISASPSLSQDFIVPAHSTVTIENDFNASLLECQKIFFNRKKGTTSEEVRRTGSVQGHPYKCHACGSCPLK